MKIPFLDLKRGFDANADAFDAAMREVAESGYYILGPHVKALEQAMAVYLDVEHTLACASGTDALHLAVAAAGIGPGDEVITTPFTFAATIESIEYVGATAILADIDPDTFNIDVNRIAEAITPRTRAIMPVHLFGLPADMQSIMDLARAKDLIVIEDAAQSLGGRWHERQTGSIGHFGAFSFYPSKTLGCFGDGGMVACRDSDMYSRLLELRNHGFDTRGEHVRLGYNSRLDEIQAAVIEIKLPQLDGMIERRRAIAQHYNEALSKTSAELQANPDDTYHAYGYYTLCVANRDRVRQTLQDAGVATALYYGKPLHRHEHYAKTCRHHGLTAAEHASGRCLSLPIYPEMSDAEIEYVAETTASAIA